MSNYPHPTAGDLVNTFNSYEKSTFVYVRDPDTGWAARVVSVKYIDGNLILELQDYSGMGENAGVNTCG